METKKVSKEWDQQSAEMNAAILEWREQHPRATFREIEAEIDRRLDELRAKMLSDTANLSASAAWIEDQKGRYVRAVGKAGRKRAKETEAASARGK